jgi:predicted amidohydrolase YtcJ
MNDRTTPPLSRRRFLIGAGATLAWLLTGCGRRGQQTQVPIPGSTTSPTLPAGPTLTPISSPVPAGANLPADMVLRGGKVITVDAADTIAQAVALRDGLIQAVGADQEIARYVGPATQVVELAGRALTPGLIDAHNHFQVMGQMHGYYVPFIPPEIRTIPDLQAKLADLVAQTPAGEWIKGYYLAFQEGRMPTRQDLDVVSPDHPVWVIQQGGHFGTANTRGLQVAGITRDTPDPTGGIIEHDAQGEPTGVLYNHRAMDLLRRNIAPPTTAEIYQYIVDTQALFAACGVTSFQDNNVRGVETIQTYRDAGAQLYLRGDVYYTLEWPQDLDRALKEIEYFQDNMVRFAGFKFLIDGQAPTAYCHAPHNGISWNMPTWEPQAFKDAVRALHDTGLQICVHCAGDAAVDLVLDAYEAAMNANPRPDPRHRIEHGILTTPEATRRMADLGVVVSTQPQFLRIGGNYWSGVFGPERTDRIIVTREWLDNGVHVALGSDAPTTPWYTPQVTLAGAVSRITSTNEIHSPEQCLTIQEALRAHTMGSAYAAHEETIKGSIEPGKLADIIVWKGDPYAMSLQQLWQAEVDMTIVGGEVVYPTS